MRAARWSIPKMNTLPEYLIYLRNREGVNIPALAKRCGLSASILYKAEDGKRTRWTTIEQGYSRLTRTAAERERMAALWMAMKMGDAPDMLREGEDGAVGNLISVVRKDAARYLIREDPGVQNVLAVLHMMPPRDRQIAVSFLSLLGRSAPTMRMAETWLENFPDPGAG